MPKIITILASSPFEMTRVNLGNLEIIHQQGQILPSNDVLFVLPKQPEVKFLIDDLRNEMVLGRYRKLIGAEGSFPNAKIIALVNAIEERGARVWKYMPVRVDEHMCDNIVRILL